ncbi:hypothetical protein ACFV8T_41410 [Streptomyces sp. NPDC059832]|uniref:hypothetical protein n=1 Tax=unclassified Streptomyces TaxID=2593676 RepID=UPI003665DE26
MATWRRRFRQLQHGPLERAEKVEMLRFAEHGHVVRMLSVADDGIAVDTPEDLARAGILLALHAGARPPDTPTTPPWNGT